MEFDFDAMEEEDSPYPEVRAAVSNIDDTEMPALTLRMWVIGLFLTLTTWYVYFLSHPPLSSSLLLTHHLLPSAANVFFNFRQPAPTIVPSVLLLLAHPIGKFMAFTMPIKSYRTPRFFGLGPYEFSLNPGPWNIKEHALVYMMTNVAVSFPYALFAVVVSEFNYEKRMGYGFSATLVLATQMTGFGLAGMSRRFLVWPASMLWPQNLVTCTLLNTFHAEEDGESGGLSRYRYFVYLSAFSFFFFFLPGEFYSLLRMICT